MEGEIRFCSAPDGARLAYATHGRGPPLVRVATDLRGGGGITLHGRLAADFRMVTFDNRGHGMSE